MALMASLSRYGESHDLREKYFAVRVFNWTFSQKCETRV